MSDIILIPGLWLDGSTWDDVLPALRNAGHRPHPVTLPGMESAEADRSSVTIQDVIDAVVAVVDATDGPAVLVGHSAAGGIAFAVADARVDRIAHVIYIGGFPSSDAEPILSGFDVENGEIAFPDWSEFDDADLRDLDDAGRERFRARAIPSPGCIATEPISLTDERRYDIPATVICPEFTAEQLRSWIEADAAPVREFRRIRTVEYVDLPTGHWPQFTRPEDLGKMIADVVDASASA